jgi:hypothetical protein
MFPWLQRTRVFPQTFWLPIIVGGLLLLYCSLLYGPLILHGGIIVDDWGDLGQNLDCTEFLDCYLNWFPFFSNRPLAPIPLVLSTLAFGVQFWAYLALNAAVYLLAISMVAVVVNRLLGALPALGFWMLAAVPIIAMPVITSPINCLINNTSFVLWAGALLMLAQYCKTQRLLWYGLSYLCLALSLLTYEIILPLLVITVMLPYALDSQASKKSLGQYVMRYVVPVLVVVMLMLVWQKMIAPQLFTVVYSRIEWNWDKIYWGFTGWPSIFYEQLPGLFKKLIVFAPLQSAGWILGVFGLYFLLGYTLGPAHSSLAKSRFILLCMSLVCVASFGLFALGGAKEVEIGNYAARILSSTWIAFALLLAALVGASRAIWRALFLIVLVSITALSTASFVISRDQYIASWQLQQKIIADVITLMKQQSITQNLSVLGDVPQYLDKNFNQEVVFSAPWDFGFALRIYSRGQVTGGAILDSTRGLYHDLKLDGDGILVDGFWKAQVPQLAIYQFDPRSEKGVLTLIRTPEQLHKQLLSLGYLGELGQSSTIGLGQTINFGKPWMARHQFIGPGWFSEIESWGGIWSAKTQAQLLLPMPTTPAKSISFVANALVTSKHPQQRVEILLNSQLQKTVTLTQASDNQFTLAIPQALQDSKTITIDFKFLDAISPHSLGMNGDTRTLALGLKQIRFD